jgi:hypothetical protein
MKAREVYIYIYIYIYFTFIVLYFAVFSSCLKINIMDTYHAAFWSSNPSRFSASEEEDEVRYKRAIFRLLLPLIHHS